MTRTRGSWPTTDREKGQYAELDERKHGEDDQRRENREQRANGTARPEPAPAHPEE